MEEQVIITRRMEKRQAGWRLQNQFASCGFTLRSYDIKKEEPFPAERDGECYLLTPRTDFLSPGNGFNAELTIEATAQKVAEGTIWGHKVALVGGRWANREIKQIQFELKEMPGFVIRMEGFFPLFTKESFASPHWINFRGAKDFFQIATSTQGHELWVGGQNYWILYDGIIYAQKDQKNQTLSKFTPLTK